MSSDKLKIIQLPYLIKSQRQQDNALKRRREIEKQLIYDSYGYSGILCLDINETYMEVTKNDERRD